MNAFIKIIGWLAVLGVSGLAFSRMETNNEPVIAGEPVPFATTTVTTSIPIANKKNKYTDGVYAADGKYSSPAGKESVSVTLTIKDDIVMSVDAIFSGKALNPGSIRAQELFSEGFKQYVVGKPIDSIKLTVVNGSSLTPKGFMDALTKIKTEADA